MLNTKTSGDLNAVGIDIPIQKYQTRLYNKLKQVWPVNDLNCESFGQSYKNKTDAGYIPEVFVSSLNANNTINKEVFFDQQIHKALSFFYVDESRTNEAGGMTAKVSIFFIVNVGQIKTLPWRGTEETLQDVLKIALEPIYGFELDSVETGFRNVFREYDGWLSNDQLTFMDIQPFFCFKVIFNVLYNIYDNK